MPELIFNNAQVFLATSTSATPFDISAFITRCRLQRQFDLHDDTRMGLTAHSRIAGIEDWTAELEILQDFASTSIGATMGMDKLVASILGVRAQLTMRPVNGARTSDNPEFTGSVMLESYSPMDGSVGDLLKLTIPFKSAGSLTRIASSS